MTDSTSHPSAAEMMAYAESLVDDRSTVSVMTAAHMASCSACQMKVAAVRGSLGLVAAAPALECSRQSTARILLAAKNERRGATGRQRRHRSRLLAARGLAYAACLAVMMSAAYGAAHWNVWKEDGVRPEPPRQLTAGIFALEALRKASPEEERLSAAVMAPQQKPQSPWEQERRRAILMLDDDISEALKALERNPACVRASKLVSTNRVRLKETLKALYVERSL